MRDLEGITKIVSEILVDDFENINIIDVKVSEEEDYDGDIILKIIVIFDGDRRKIDARKMSSVVGHVLPRLKEFGEKAFPILSFISESDARQANM